MIKLLGEQKRKELERYVQLLLNRCAELQKGCNYCPKNKQCNELYLSVMNCFYRFQGRAITEKQAQEHAEYLKTTKGIDYKILKS